MKKIALLFILVFLPMLACADAVEIDGIYYTLVPDSKVAEVTSDPNKYTGDITIPTTIEYDGEVYDVTAIGNNAFYDCKNISSVTIGNSVESIGHYAFAGCGRLASLTIPNSVGTIGNSAFSLCNGLRSLNIGNSVTSIGRSTFNGCSSLSSVIIPNGVTSIGDYAFQQCIGMASVTIPNSVTSIGNAAFLGCGLTSVTIPNSVKSIGDAAFQNCQRVTSIVVEDGNPVYDSRNNSNAIIETASNRLIAGCNNTTIPNGVTSIGNYAFQKCLFLTSVIIPSSVTSIGDGAFRDCRAVREIVNKAQTPPVCGIQPFYGINISECKLYVPASSVSAYQAVEPWKNFKEIVALPARDASILCDGRSWKYEYSETDWESLTEEQKLNGDYQSLGRVTYNYWLRVEGNELFDGRQCKKIVYDGFNGTGLYGYGYEDDGRVMVYALKDEPAFCAQFPTEQWVMLYDFNVAKDSHCDMGAFWTRDLIVSVEGTVKVGDVDKRFIGLSDAQHPTWPLRYAVDGVGCSSGLYEFENIIDNGSSSRFVGCYDGDVCIFSAENFNALTTPKDDYRPFVEDGKVWKVGSTTGISDSIVKMVEYYYFDGDTIIDGKTFKQMMCQRYVNHNHPNYTVIVKYPLLRKVGAWYEEDKTVYFYNATSKQFRMMYDFSLNANDTLLIDNYYPYVIGPKQTGGLEGFKGIYRDVMWCTDRDPFYCTTWLEGVGGIDGPTINIYYGKEDRGLFLMSCTVGDEVIYLNDKYEDGATPEEVVGARKDRIDFTHTIKIRPKTRMMKEAEAQSLYGEYNSQQLGINLNALDEAYQVSITDEAGKVVYEKTVNAGSIVGLNIDISAYAKGRYTVTVENSNELFTGQFETLATGIEENVRIEEFKNGSIYNLQGQRINSLRKGMNIVRSAEGRLQGKKVFVK